MGESNFYYSDLYKRIANQQKVLLNKEMDKHGVTNVQSLVVLYVLEQEKQFGPEHEVTQKDVEHYLNLRSSTVTHILARAEENGLITREKSLKDSRAKHLSVTPKGQNLIPVFFSVLDSIENKMTAGMNEEERQLLKRLLSQVADNLTDEKG